VADVLTLPVRTIVASTPRTRILRLDLQGAPFAFRAGQAALIGLHGQPQRRPYSIASAPDDARRHGRLEFLLKVDDTGYAGPHLPRVARHEKIDLEGPIGSFTLPPANGRGGHGDKSGHGGQSGHGGHAGDAGRSTPSSGAPSIVTPSIVAPPAVASPAGGYFFVAGGTGISPLRSMMRELLTEAAARGGVCPPISVLYSARTADEFAYGAELRRLARGGAIRVTQTVTGDVGPAWAGVRGRISVGHLEQALPSREALCFVCGPPSLVDEVPRMLWHLGVQPNHVRTEEW
jgi:ferredoxin-NADP reductase